MPHALRHFVQCDFSGDFDHVVDAEFFRLHLVGGGIPVPDDGNPQVGTEFQCDGYSTQQAADVFLVVAQRADVKGMERPALRYVISWPKQLHVYYIRNDRVLAQHSEFSHAVG